MALVKTNYGLIYNDDGSLCVTLRKDDVPFEGVVSVAVEEGTTNLATGDTASFQTGVGSWGNGTFEAFSWQNVYNDFFKRNGVLYLKNTTGSGYIYWLYSNTTPQIYSASMYIKLISGNANDIRCGGVFHYSDGTITDYTWGDKGIAITRRIHLGNNIYRIETVNMMYDQSKLDAGKTIKQFQARISTINITQTTEFYVLAYQLEARPFATSYTPSTRPDGQLIIDNLPAGTPKVVSVWLKYPKTVINGILEILLSLQEPGWANQIAEGWWLGFYGGNLIFRNHVIGDSPFYWDLNTGLTPADLYNKWVFLTIAETSSTTTDVYVKGEGIDYKGTLVLQKPYNFRPTRLRLSNWEDGGAVINKSSALFANRHLARYKPAVWTAEYIQELYNMRRPFSTPPKLPII
jgi:hypothetical protein